MKRFFWILIIFLPHLASAQGDANFAQEIRKEFQFAWNNYLQFAGNTDILKPISKKGEAVYFEPFLLTRIENLSTLKLMGLPNEYDANKRYIKQTLSFDKKKVYVPTAEFGQRMLSALLSAYQTDGDRYFLTMAIDLANRLLPAFGTRTGMPTGQISLNSRALSEPINTPARIAALAPQFELLSKLTRNPLYHRKAYRAVEALFDLRDTLGLLGARIDVQSGIWIDRSTHLSPSTAGYYDAVLKAYLISGVPAYKRIWQQGIADAKKILIRQSPKGTYFAHLRPNRSEDSTFYLNDLQLVSHFALAGQSDLAGKLWYFANSLTDSIAIVPYIYNLKKNRPMRFNYELLGYDAEALMWLSVYKPNFDALPYAHKLFEAVRRTCRTPQGYTDINDTHRPVAFDRMPAEFMARWLKALYLIAAPDALDLKKVIFVGSAQPLHE